MFFRRLTVSNQVSPFHQLLSAYGETATLAGILFQCTIVAQDAPTFEAIVGCHFRYGLQSIKAKSR